MKLKTITAAVAALLLGGGAAVANDVVTTRSGGFTLDTRDVTVRQIAQAADLLPIATSPSRQNKDVLHLESGRDVASTMRAVTLRPRCGQGCEGVGDGGYAGIW